jgi:hypothetical protein
VESHDEIKLPRQGPPIPGAVTSFVCRWQREIAFSILGGQMATVAAELVMKAVATLIRNSGF